MESPDTRSRTPKELLAHYRRLRRPISAGPASRTRETASESTEEAMPADIDVADVPHLEKILREQLYEIVKKLLGDQPALYEIADQIAKSGATGLRAYAAGDEELLSHGDVLRNLEVVVHTDGTRPSFMIRNGVPDLKSSPAGEWPGAIEVDSADFRSALACVGRIDEPSASQGFQGTGTLVAPNIVLTNRHVLQAIGSQASDGRWTIKPNAAIDFGHEYKATDTLNRRVIKSVIFAGAIPIDPYNIVHSKFDAALLELEPVARGTPAPACLPLDFTNALDTLDKRLFLVGYPADPGYRHTPPSLLEQLFSSTFGYKRLAPGLVMTPTESLPNNPRKWSLGHDATTLGGNSGSAIIIIGRYGASAGLHYGGSWVEPRENWCHTLGPASNETDGRSTTTFKEILAAHDVDVVTS